MRLPTEKLGFSAMEAQMNAPKQIDSNTSQRFAQVPIQAIEGTCSGKLTPEVFRYYAWLCSVSDRQGQSWWSLGRQATLFNASPRTVRRWRQALTELDFVKLEPRYGHATRVTVVHHPQRSFTPDTPRPGGGTPGVREGGHPVSSITINKKNNTHSTTVVVSNGSANADPIAQNDDDRKRDELEEQFNKLSELAEKSGLPNFRYSRHWLFKPEQKYILSDLLNAPEAALHHGFVVIRDNYPNLQQPQRLVEILLDRVASFRPGVSTTKVQQSQRRNPRTPRTASNQNRRQHRKLYPDAVEPPDPPQPAKSHPVDVKIRSTWIQVLAAIQSKVPEPTFNRWFKSLGAKFDSGLFTVICDDDFDVDFTRKNFTSLLELYIQRHFERPFELQISCSQSELGRLDEHSCQGAVQ